MKIISIESIEVNMIGMKYWFVVVTVFNLQTGEGEVVPFGFDTPEDAEDSIEHFTAIAKLQGGDVQKLDTSSQN